MFMWSGTLFIYGYTYDCCLCNLSCAVKGKHFLSPANNEKLTATKEDQIYPSLCCVHALVFS